MRRHLLLPALAVAALWAPTADADPPTDVEALLSEPIVTTVSKTPESGRTAPATSTILTGEEIRRYGLRTLAEAIDFLSLGVATSTHLNSPEMGARGTLITGDQNNHFLLLIDGHTVNEPLSGGMEIGRGAGIPLELVDHVEVILGPGSVVYGTSAMFGVINVVTKHAKDFPGVHVFADTSIVSNGRVGAGAGYEFTLFGARSEVTAAVEYFTKNGPGIQMPIENTGIDPATGLPERYSRSGPPTGIWGGLATHTNTAQAPSAYVRLTTGRLEVAMNASIFRQGIPDSPRSFDDPLNREIDRRASLDAIYRMPISGIAEMSVRGYADLYEREAYQVDLYQGCPAYCVDARPGTARWAGTEVRAAFDWLRNDRFVTTLGVDARVRSVSAATEHLDGPTGAPITPATGVYSRTDLPLAAYAQQTLRPVRWLFFNAGVRADSDPRFTPVVSPRVAAGVMPWEGATFRAVYAQAFRSPSWDETNSYAATQLVAGGLVPESVQTVDASFEQRFGTHRIRVGVFGEDWGDLVELHELSAAEAEQAFAAGQLPGLPHDVSIPIHQVRNVNEVRSVGANLGYEGAVGGLRLAANVTGARSTELDTASPLAGAPQLFGNARASYDFGGRLPVVALAARYIGRRLADSADGGFAPTPTVSPQAELRGTITGVVPGVTGLTFRTMASYTFGSAEPYVVGPVQHPLDTSPNAGLLPIVERFRVLVGLQYDF